MWKFLALAAAVAGASSLLFLASAPEREGVVLRQRAPDRAAHAPPAAAVPYAQAPAALPPDVPARAAPASRPGAHRAALAEAVSMFRLDAGGSVVLDEDTRQAIDAVLSASPERHDMADLQHALGASFPADDARKIMALVRNYASYAGEMQDEVAVLGVPQTVAELQASMRQVDGIRNRHFDQGSIEKLFGPNEAYARLAMEVALVRADPAFDDAAKQARVEGIRSMLPADKRMLVDLLSRPDGG